MSCKECEKECPEPSREEDSNLGLGLFLYAFFFGMLMLTTILYYYIPSNALIFINVLFACAAIISVCIGLVKSKICSDDAEIYAKCLNSSKE